MILAIDPGNIQSAYILMNENYEIVEFGKIDSEEVLEKITSFYHYIPPYIIGALPNKTVVIEMVASYGMAVGKSIFDTVVWIGRFKQKAIELGFDVDFIYRQEEKMNLCNSMRAKDTNIRQALIDRFAKFDFKNGKGTKNEQDWFYGFSKDVWAAYAVGVTYLDKMKKEAKKE
jgi:hypothetical protein